MSELKAPSEILAIWKKFDGFPMETITKAWFLKHYPLKGQRTVEEMIAHRSRTLASGNCFDLAIWLIDEFKFAGIDAYAIGENLGTPKAHVGVIAHDRTGGRYLCDLGDLWIQPIAIDKPSTALHLDYFTGPGVKISNHGDDLCVEFHRSNGKISKQNYQLRPIRESELRAAGEFSQLSLSRPLVEMRVQNGCEIIHWEFDDFSSFTSSHSGLSRETPLGSDEAWAERISARTRMKKEYVLECLLAYRELSER